MTGRAFSVARRREPARGNPGRARANRQGPERQSGTAPKIKPNGDLRALLALGLLCFICSFLMRFAA